MGYDFMNIAYFVWEYPPKLLGGLGTYAAEITKQFAVFGHNVDVFSMNYSDDKLPILDKRGKITVHRPVTADASEILPVFMDERTRRSRIGRKVFADVISYNIVAASKFTNICCKERDYGVIICHDWVGAVGGVAAKSSTKKPMVFHVHSTEFGRQVSRGSSTITELEHTAARQADRVITVSHVMKEDLRQLGFAKEKVRVMWNGVDEKKYNLRNFRKAELLKCRKSLGLKEDDKVILFIGRLTYVKGVDSLLRAMPRILSKVKKARLVILGMGDAEKKLKALTSRLGIASKVIFINKWVPEKYRLLLNATSDVLCAPSRYEPFGIVALEGMAMEKPVVVGLGGLRESVLENITGLHCNPDKPTDIAKKLIQILSDDALAASMGKKGRERVEKIFTWKKIAKQTLDLYKGVL